MRRTLPLFVLLAACMFPLAASAQTTWFPMHVGNEWNYISNFGEQEVLTFTRVETIAGREVFVLTYSSVPNAGLENYWSAGPDGDVLLSGFFRSVENSGLLYDPPIPLLDAPPSLGRTWTHTTRVTELPSMVDLGPLTLGFEVYSEGLLSVPAGVFYAYGIGQTGSPAVLEHAPGLDLCGQRLSGGPLANDWWTDGLGRAQYLGIGILQLSRFDFPTPPLTSTWGAVKSLYR